MRQSLDMNQARPVSVSSSAITWQDLSHFHPDAQQGKRPNSPIPMA